MVESHILKTTIAKEDREFFSSHLKQCKLAIELVNNGYLFNNRLTTTLNIGLEGAMYCFMTVSNEAHDKKLFEEYHLLSNLQSEIIEAKNSDNDRAKKERLFKAYRVLNTYLITGVIVL